MKCSALRHIPVNRNYDAYVFACMKLPVHTRTGRVLCIGRVTAIQGRGFLLRAIARAPKISNFDCVMVGDGDPGSVAELNALSPKEVYWYGTTNNAIELLASCSVLVCPSYREPLGRVIFNAWDCGAVPVVYAGSGGAAEIVLAEGGGILYAAQTPECLADAIDKALSRTQKDADYFIAYGRKWMAANCAPDAYGRAVTKTLTAAAYH